MEEINKMKKLFVVFTAIALVSVFALTASAAEWDFYGSARVATIYHHNDDDNSGINEYDITKTIGKDDGGTNMDLQGNSRVGAKVKVNDEIGGRFEYGTGVNIRHLYGTWDFDGGQLLIGQTYTPIYQGYSDQVWNTDEGMASWGNTDPGRSPMIQIKTGGFKVALIRPQVNANTNKGLPSLPDKYTLTTASTPEVDVDTTSGVTTISSSVVDAYLPKLEVSYSMKTDEFFFDVSAGAQTYKIEIDTINFDESVNSFVIGADFGMNFGIAGFVVKGHYSVNGKSYGLISATDNQSVLNVAANDLYKNETYAVQALLNVNPSDTLAIQAGVGYSASELDRTGYKKDDSTCYYAQAALTVVPGLYIIPEVGYIDEMDSSSGADQGSTFYAGAKWQINF